MKASEIHYERMTAAQLLNLINECQSAMIKASEQYEKIVTVERANAWLKVKTAIEEYEKISGKKIIFIDSKTYNKFHIDRFDVENYVMLG